MLTSAAFAVMLMPHASADNLRKVQQTNSEPRKLIFDADRSKRCFIDGRNNGLNNPHDADFNENPFLANRDRGDWGKCMPEEVFGALCVHEMPHMLNDGSWMDGDGPLHDEASEQMFLKLQQLHNDYCVHVDINIPDDVQVYFDDFMFARGIFSIADGYTNTDGSGNIMFSVTGGALTVNGAVGGAITLHRGSTYIFDQSDPSNANHPLGFKTSEGHIFQTGVEAPAPGLVGNAGAVLTFTVPNDAPDTLEYYCKYHPRMPGGVVHIEDAVDVRPSLRRMLQEHGDHSEITYDMACNTDYSSNPRLAFQMSIFCALGFIDQSIDTTKTHLPYELSSSCDAMMRHNSRHQMYPEVMYAPDRFCDQDVEADTCTVRAFVRTTEKRTCAEYCEGFDLECKAAGIDFWWGCSERRPWTCDEPQDSESYLLCTCGAPATPEPEPVTALTPACAKQLLPSSNPPNRFCDQDFGEDTCTVQARLTSYVEGTCSEYCASHNLECVGASEDNGCIATGERSCDLPSSSFMLCTCTSPATTEDPGTGAPTAACDSYCETKGEGMVCLSALSTPLEDCVINGVACENEEDFASQLKYVCGPSTERVDLVEEMATKSCERMAFSPDLVHRPRTFCPPHTLSPAEEDSCTVLAFLNNIAPDRTTRTCDAYCRSFPGMKCLAAAEERSNDCVVKETLECSQPYSSSTSDLLCACGIDDAQMTSVVQESETPMSPACQAMAMDSDAAHPVKRVCESFPEENSCTVLANVFDLPERTCANYCASFPGMTCVAAAEDNRGTCEEKSALTCETVTTSRDTLCTCAFKADAPNAAYRDIAPLFEKNAASTCPAYETAINSEGNEYYTNEGDRSYTKLTLTLDVDGETGKVDVTDIDTDQDMGVSDIDTYNTAHVEFCDGFESLRREGDAEEKCSFGHRLDKSQNCYGKVYGQNFKEARKSCAERGGHIVKIDDAAEYDVLKSIFGDQSFFIGLHDVGGRDWEWDGYPGVSADPYTNTYAPLAATEQWDCAEIDLKRNELTTDECWERKTWMCEGIPSADDVANGRGGDLLADEGGFCLWYLEDPTLSLPDDEDNGFSNTELAHFLQYDPSARSRKYIKLYDELYSASNIRGHPENEVNWETLTYRNTLGIPSDTNVIDKAHSGDKFHCHFSPTNFGVSRIYAQQHMLERIYPGAMHKHCFCGYKNIGHFVTRCDCTRSGERNGNCQEHHRNLLFEETFRETGEYVFCNNNQCDDASP